MYGTEGDDWNIELTDGTQAFGLGGHNWYNLDGDVVRGDIVGGSGVDTLNIWESSSDFLITSFSDEDGVCVANADESVVIHMTGVEKIQFADGVVNISDSSAFPVDDKKGGGDPPPPPPKDDFDGDGRPDDTDADDDNDGVSDHQEINDFGTDPLNPDTDDDGIQDGTELGFTTGTPDSTGGDFTFRPDADPTTTTDPLDKDTDDDGLLDGEEDVNADGASPRVIGGTGTSGSGETDPNNPDTDGDGLTDGQEENQIGSDPLDTDTDDGTVADGVEVNQGTNPVDDPSDDIGVLFDVDTKACLYTEDVWFGMKPDRIVFETGRVDRDLDGNRDLDGIGLDLEAVKFDSGDLTDANPLLNVRTITSIDTSLVDEMLRDMGAEEFSIDGNADGFAVDFNYFAASEPGSGFLPSLDDVPTEYLFIVNFVSYSGEEGSVEVLVVVDEDDIRNVSPIAFDLNDNGQIDVTGNSTVKGHIFSDDATTVEFDIDADGTLDTIEWLAGTGDGLLIDTTQIGPGNSIDGSALFGDLGGLYENGYEKLALLDTNGDDVISGSEAANLTIWVDDGDAVLEAGEQVSLASQFITGISLDMSTDSDGRMISDTHIDAEAAGVVSYSLSGDDAEFFSVDGSTGELTWANGFPPATAQDDDGDGIYEVSVDRDGDHCDANAVLLEVDSNGGVTVVPGTATPTANETQTGGDDDASFEVKEPDEDDFADTYRLYDEDRELLATLSSDDFSEDGTDRLTGLRELDWEGEEYGFDPRDVYFVTAQNDGEAESELTDVFRRNVSPIALDLNGDGQIGVTGQHTAQIAVRTEIGETVQFDIDADGSLDTIEWFAGDGDGILVNTSEIGPNDEIDGSALFGDQGGQFANGYEQLSLLDANGDGRISGFEHAELALWVDDGDAVLEDGELQSLSDHEIAALNTDMALDNEGRMRSTAERTDGSTVVTEDVWFAVKPTASSALMQEDFSL